MAGLPGRWRERNGGDCGQIIKTQWWCGGGCGSDGHPISIAGMKGNWFLGFIPVNIDFIYRGHECLLIIIIRLWGSLHTHMTLSFPARYLLCRCLFSINDCREKCATCFRCPSSRVNNQSCVRKCNLRLGWYQIEYERYNEKSCKWKWCELLRFNKDIYVGVHVIKNDLKRASKTLMPRPHKVESFFFGQIIMRLFQEIERAPEV
jgi:hypothetical protein